MALDPALLEILRCPDEHHAVLAYDAAAQTLTCTECQRIFEVRDGIPVLLLDEARLPDGGRPDGGRPDGGRPGAGDEAEAGDR